MSDSDSVRWMVTFFHSEGRRQDERDFPKVDFWYPTKKASMEAGARVLQELIRYFLAGTTPLDLDRQFANAGRIHQLCLNSMTVQLP